LAQRGEIYHDAPAQAVERYRLREVTAVAANDAKAGQGDDA
jgi:hypothetical protein